MKIPEGERVCCAADLFEYDETKKLNLRQFLPRYKDQFPMLIVIIGGHYGETKFDCYDNFQVLRIHCYTSQPRVIAEDTRLNPRSRKGYITIPIDTSINYRVIKGHTKLGNPQPLKELLEENDRLPLLVQMACDPQYPIRVGNSHCMARDFGHIMIKEKYMEHFYMMNAIDGVALNMNKLICMACLCEELEASPVTGFKYGTKEEFEEFCRKLSKDVAESGEVYDTSKGNEDYSEYSFDEMRYLLEISDSSSGLLTDGAEAKSSSSDDDDYQDIPPDIPSRNPLPPRRAKIKKKVSNAQESNEKISQSPTSPKFHHKSPFGFLKKKHRNEIENKKEKDIKQSKDKTNPYTISPKPEGQTNDPKPEVQKSDQPDIKTRPNFPPRIKDIPAVSLGARPLPDIKEDVKAGYVTLASKRTYMNTQIGRATVKPMPKNSDKSKEQAYLPMNAGRKEEKETEEELSEDDEYETVEDIPKIQNKTNPPATSSPLISELQNKILQGSTEITDEAEEDEDDNYEVVGEVDTEGYMVPMQHSQSKVSRPVTKQSPVQSNKQHKKDQAPMIQSDKQYQKDQEHLKERHTYENEFKVTSLTIHEVTEALKELGLEKYTEVFTENKVDGEILASLNIEDLTNELGLKKLEALRLHKFAKNGHIPK